MKVTKLFFALILLLLISCGHEDKYYRLDHTKWFKYEVGDSLIFKNTPALIDTYIISNIDNYFQTYDNETFNEKLFVEYEKVSGCNNCPDIAFIRHVNVIYFFGNVNINGLHYENPLEYSLGDTVLKDIYKVENIPVDSVHYLIKIIYYSDIYGIIRYDMYDDRVYELQIE